MSASAAMTQRLVEGLLALLRRRFEVGDLLGPRRAVGHLLAQHDHLVSARR